RPPKEKPRTQSAPAGSPWAAYPPDRACLHRPHQLDITGLPSLVAAWKYAREEESGHRRSGASARESLRPGGTTGTPVTGGGEARRVCLFRSGQPAPEGAAEFLELPLQARGLALAPARLRLRIELGHDHGAAQAAQQVPVAALEPVGHLSGAGQAHPLLARPERDEVVQEVEERPSDERLPRD